MSFYDADAHAQQGHADSCIYSFSQGGPWCLACLLNSLADVTVLNGRKAYLLRCVSLVRVLTSTHEMQGHRSDFSGPRSDLAVSCPDICTTHMYIYISVQKTDT